MILNKNQEVIGTITLNGSYLRNADQEELEALAVTQTELGRILSRILVSNKMSSKLLIYTMRDDDTSFNITVSYVKA